jgi:hypothetical protein
MTRLLAIWIGLMLGSAVVDAAEVPLRRWAVLAAPEVREAGISDLLTAKLSEREFELVEREQLDAAQKELRLSQLLGAQTSERLSLGARLRADVLMLVSVVEFEQSRTLKIVISECRQGARLRAELVPWSLAGKSAAADEVAQLVVTIAAETRSQFAGGVRELVAVTPLLSKNLTREFDHLQTGYAALLGRAISQSPGTAVVEIDEARAIRQELIGTGDAIKDRLVPLFVEGEFVTSGRGPDAQARITLRITDGQKERRQLARDGMTLAQSVEWLMNQVPREIAARPSDSAKATPVSREQQFERLARRAETFSRAAAFEESTALREAALLLKGDDAEQRLWLIADSNRVLNDIGQKARELHEKYYLANRDKVRAVGEVALDDAVRVPLFEQARQRVERMDELFRWLLIRRAISRREATWFAPAIAQVWINVRGLARNDEQDEFLKLADEPMAAMLAAYWQLDPDLRPREAHPTFEHLSLPGGGNVGNECRQHDQLCQAAGNYWLLNWELPRRGSPSQRYAAWQQFVKHHASQSLPSSHLLLGLFDVRKLPPDAQAERQRFQAFCTELEETNKPLFRLYARSGRLALSMCEPRKTWDATMDREAKSLQQAWREYLKSEPDFLDAAFAFEVRFQPIVNEVEQVVRRGGSKAYALSPNTLIGVDPDPRIAFEPLPDLPAPWSQWQRIHDRLDVLWTVNSVWTMSEPGRPRLVYETTARTDLILDLCCDGRLIWVFTQESGLLAFTLDGRQVGTLFPEDVGSKTARPAGTPQLPPFGITMTQRQMAISAGARMRSVGPTGLHPIAPGRCLVLGMYQPKQRLWLAAVSAETNSAEKSEFQVQVIHEATTDAQRVPVGDDDNTAESFRPIWMTEIQTSAQPARRVLLVGRPVFFTTTQLRTGRRPLAVDLDSLEVSVFPGRFGPSEQSGEPRYFGFGRMSFARGHSLNLLSPPNDPSALDWSLKELVPFFPPLDQRVWWRIPSRTFVANGDHWENPGPLWRRVFPAEGRLEQLTPEPIALRHRFRHYSLSAHYGLVAWNNGDIAYRVHFNRDPTAPRDIAWLYPFVPPVERERHHRAVQSIREQGGFVDSVWQGLPNNWTLQPDGWATKVFLSEVWRGGDVGLNALADLHQLRELKIVQAPITNAGLEAIGRVTSLRTLSLEETATTDEGLPQLAGLKELTNLRLENVIGGSAFTDAGLELIQQLPKLEKLTVSGPGFTDEGLERLRTKLSVRPLLFRDFRPLDTNMSKLKLEELRAGRSSLAISFQPEPISLGP